MDSFEWNKILGAILGTLLFVFIVNEVAHIVYPSDEPVEELAYELELPETGEAAAGPQEPEVVDFGTLLQQASAEEGESVARRCLQCHSFEKGGPHKTGPNLWGILGRDIASKDGFRYSSTLSNMDGEWTYERVYEFVAAPSRYAPGTSMNFAGLRRQNQRIDLLAYLRTQDDNPPPIPEPLPEEPAEEAGAAAEDGEEADGDTAEQPAGEGAATEEASGEEGSEDAAGGDETPAPGTENGAAEGTDETSGEAGGDNAHSGEGETGETAGDSSEDTGDETPSDGEDGSGDEDR